MNRPLRETLADAAGSVAMLGALVLVWWLASHLGWISRAFLPSPEATVQSIVQGWSQGALAGYTGATVGRMLVGWLLASLMGISLGVWIGSSALARAWLQPTLEFFRPLPASAVMPPAIAVFGLSTGMVLFVVAFGAMWPVLLATAHGVASVHRGLREVSSAMQLSRWQYLWKIALPHTVPDILSGLRLSLTVSLIVSVVGEMMASQTGLGQAVLLAARSFRAPDLFAGVLLLGAIGVVSNLALAAFEQRALRWQRSH
ncbi:ABC transporter permease [Ideonella sp. DXS29W]|uniref:ABC transporter permease n=1 Tax=Ideonella lacteola TaxID=2984193 RepID=A0ABU9BHR3_9BURK